ncbi:UNVERIFIED_CONTAM: hypothetical protein GTU68_032423 [Idotea baltica]|nr:hypothetical protein [Idotea baltica]
MIEKHKIGGECTHFGCVPSKALINAAKSYHSLKKMEAVGISIEPPKVDFATVMEKVDEIVQGIYQHETPDIFQNMGIDVYVNDNGAKFIDYHTISIGDEQLSGKHFVISTGSSPRIPDIEGMEHASILHNENFWELREKPEKIVFIGGGVISVELGQSLARLGSEVCIMERNDRIMKVTDPEVGAYLTEQIEKEGVKIITNANILKFTDKNTLSYESEGETKTVTADHFFVAAGRSANAEGMDLENAGVEFTHRGIVTNEFLQTSAKHIYACGDVTTPFKFTHTASHQANITIDNILNPGSKVNDLNVLPWAVFTEPQIGHVGMTETEAVAQYGQDNIQVFKVEAAIDRFITDRKTGGMLKVIFNADDFVVGAEAVGAHAGEWIQLLTLAIKNKIPAQQMADTIFAYPSYSEKLKKPFSRVHETKLKNDAFSKISARYCCLN